MASKCLKVKIFDFGKPVFKVKGDDPEKIAEEVERFIKEKFR